MTVLEAKIPEAGYGKKVVLRNVSICVDDGDIVALIGPNGAGKSTILKVIMGIVANPNGSVSLNSKSCTRLDPEDIVRKGISFVPQGNRVFTELTVKENLEVGGYLLKESTEVERCIKNVLEIFPELSNRLKETAGKLSGGEKQQLALARALMLTPKILLLDEPSLGLSPKLVKKAFDTIRDINQRFRPSILIVEQKVHEVVKIANCVYGLRMGQVVFEGIPTELHSDALKKIFLV